MWRCALLLMFLGLPVLSSCVDRKAAASRMEVASVEYFESGHIDKALESAQSLSSYDLNSANYLLGQYAIYVAAGRGGDFSSGLNEGYKKILSIDADAHPNYSSQYLVAKSFSLMFLSGNGDAMDFFTSACKTAMQFDANPCAWAMLNKFSSSYMTTHQRMDAVTLYEAARVAHDLHLADDYVSSFYMAIAMVRMDDKQSSDIIKNLESIGRFNPVMRAAYCLFMQSDSVKNTAVDCSGSTKEMHDLILSAKKRGLNN